MDTDIFQISILPYAAPGLLHVSEILAINMSSYDIGVVVDPDRASELVDCSLAEIDCLLSRL